MPSRRLWDRWLFFTATLLLAGGVLMVGSASGFVSLQKAHDPTAFYVKHAVNLLVGLAALVAALYVPYRVLARRVVVFPALAIGVLSLIYVLATPAVAGAHRWISFAGMTVQPSELAKLLVIVFIAYMLERHDGAVNERPAVPLTCIAIVGLLAFLVVIEPDLGSAVVLVAVACVMIFAAGLSWVGVGAAAALGSLAFVVGVFAESYRTARVRSFLSTLLDPTVVSGGSNFQLEQSLLAIGSGGWTGVGLGQGQQKAHFVPEVHTDFIFSVIGEELGLLGALVLLVAYLLIFWRGMRVARRAPDIFGSQLALGLTTLLVFQALINMGVCLGLLPTTGLPLPFISYGGSSLLASMAAVGLLTNVSQHSN